MAKDKDPAEKTNVVPKVDATSNTKKKLTLKIAELKKNIAAKKKALISIVALVVVLIAGTALAIYYKNRTSYSPVTTSDQTTNQGPTIISPATLNAKKGTAKIISKEVEKTIAENESADIFEGDVLETSADARAEIIYKEGDVVIVLAQNTKLTFSVEGTKSLVNQTSGSVFVRFKKVLGTNEELEVETPTALATVRGTSFLSKIGANDLTKILVTDNEVDVFKKDDKTGNVLRDQKYTIKAGFQSIIEKGKPPTNTKHSLTPDEKELLLSQIDRIENKDVINFLRATPSPTPSGSATPTPKAVSYSSTMPGEGYTVTRVKTPVGEYPLSCMGSSLSSTRIITDSGNESDCANDCPVMPLAEFATRNGGFAAMNGMYFCPADYPACADKKNSFDTLFFNSRVRKYINSDNNVYSTIPFLVINAGSNPSFLDQTLQMGRDTGIDAGTAGNPMLIKGGNNVVGNYSLEDRQKSVKANRGAVVQEGGVIYLCIVSGATVPDSASVYQTLGADNAINIDGGGSSALWVNGAYKYGPGRNIPTAIIFTRR